MKFKASVTFEFMLAPPNTVTVEVEASELSTAARRAVKAATKQIASTNDPRWRGWSSVVLLIERVSGRDFDDGE